MNKTLNMNIDNDINFKDENSLILFATHNKSLVNKSDLELTISNGTVNFN